MSFRSLRVSKELDLQKKIGRRTKTQKHIADLAAAKKKPKASTRRKKQPASRVSVQHRGIYNQNQLLNSPVSSTLPLSTPQTPEKKLPLKAPTGKKRGRPPSPWDTLSDRSTRRNVQQFTTQLEESSFSRHVLTTPLTQKLGREKSTAKIFEIF